MKCFYWGNNSYWGIYEEEFPNIINMIEEQRDAIEDEEKLTIDDYRFIYEEHLVNNYGYAVLDDWKKVPKRKQKRVLEYISRL